MSLGLGSLELKCNLRTTYMPSRMSQCKQSASDPTTFQKLLERQMETKARTHGPLHTWWKCTICIFDDLLSNVIKKSISFVFVSDSSVNTIYLFIHWFISLFIHPFICTGIILKFGILSSWSGVILTCSEHHCELPLSSLLAAHF